MLYGCEQELGSERLADYERDAARAREIGWMARPAARTTRRAAYVGAAVRTALAAITRCRWDEVERAIERLERAELRPAAQIAIRAVCAQARGQCDIARELCGRLREAPIARSADPHVWASGIVAAALHGYLTGEVDDSAQPVALVREVCERGRRIHRETMELVCLSLALLARGGASPVLASFLLGHLSDALAGVEERPASQTAEVAAGLCILALGDDRTGSRILVRAAENHAVGRLPLVAGVVGAEMARLELEQGNRQAASHWIERSRRFADRYESELPLAIISAVDRRLSAVAR
ncbi:MAG: hypothetical protein ACOCU9_02245 [Spirochaetota bacterium]